MVLADDAFPIRFVLGLVEQEGQQTFPVPIGWQARAAGHDVVVVKERFLANSRAQIMGAFSYYLANEHTKSIESSQRFLSIPPGNKDAPYAYYLIALNYYEQITDVTRDQKITQQALDSMGELIRRYPDTRYAADARLKIDLVNDHLAGKEMEIGRFYQRRAQWLASVVRFRKVIDSYDTTTHTPEALMRLTESYLALGVRDEAKKSAAVLGANYPGTKWYARAYELVQKNPA